MGDFPACRAFSERSSEGFKPSEKKLKKDVDEIRKILMINDIESNERNAHPGLTRGCFKSSFYCSFGVFLSLPVYRKKVEKSA